MMILVILTLCLVSFLAAFDNIIVASNTPFIAQDLNGFGLYSWVNTAFLLTASTSQPIYATLVNQIGRRPCFLFATSCYLLASVLCATSNSMVMLIAARAVCGLGVGAFDTLMKIIVADYVPVRWIGKYQAFLGISWGLGYLVGALLGGLAVSKSSWRVVFWMALGFSAIIWILVFFVIRESSQTNKKQHVPMDWIGILLWCTGVICLVLALSWGGTTYPWKSPVIISLLCVFVVFIALFGLYERRYAYSMVPHGLFQERSTACILIAAFSYGGCFQSLMTFVPLYLSVLLQHDAMTTNLELLCLVLFACIFNVIFGLVIVRTGKYVWAPRLSLTILLIACGLLQLWSLETTIGLVVGMMIITGVGSGGMINSEIITAQASVPIEHVPAVVAFMTFCDQVGGITGITIGSSILSNTLARGLPGMDIEYVRQNVASLAEPIQLIVKHVYMNAVKMTFWNSFGFTLFGLFATLGLRSYTLRKTTMTEEDVVEA